MVWRAKLAKRVVVAKRGKTDLGEKKRRKKNIRLTP